MKTTILGSTKASYHIDVFFLKDSGSIGLVVQKQQPRQYILSRGVYCHLGDMIHFKQGSEAYSESACRSQVFFPDMELLPTDLSLTFLETGRNLQVYIC